MIDDQTDTTGTRPHPSATGAERDPMLSRRRILTWGGALGGGLVLAACGSASGSSGSIASTTAAAAGSGAATSSSTATSALATGTPATTGFSATDFAGLGTCELLPDLTAGPFPTEDQIERRDVTEDRTGMPLRMGIQVVDEACAPIAGATVEIWHCDIDGDYSAYADGYTADDDGPGTTFLRGSQVTNDEGIVEFHTIWPGWYPSRAVHIHSKVHIDDSTVLTTQYLFEDSLNEEVLSSGVYAGFGMPDTDNASDHVTGGDADLLLAVNDDEDISVGSTTGGRRALIVVGLDPEGSSSGGSGGGPGAGGGPGGGPGGRPGF